MKAHRLPSGSWRVQVYNPETKKYLSFTEKTEDEAVYQAMLWKTKRSQTKTLGLTVGQCIDMYIESKSNVLSPTTIDKYKIDNKNWLSELHNIPIKDLTSQRVQIHINELAIRLSPKSVRNAHGLLSAALNVYAPDFHLRTTLPAKQKKIKTLPKAEDVMRLIKGTDIELPCLMAFWLGLRMSEIRGAKRSNIKNNILTIKETVVNVKGKPVRREQTKTFESTRIIRLPQPIIDLIESLPPEQDILVPYSDKRIRVTFTRLQEENNLEHMSFHELRHLNASVMHALNIPDKYAMERGGWSSTNIMKSVYMHTFSDEREEADRKINDYFEKIYSDIT